MDRREAWSLRVSYLPIACLSEGKRKETAEREINIVSTLAEYRLCV